MTWKAWIHSLNKFKIGVHLMRTHAAGTFALNCAYLGIPCIGYEGLDTQEKCHPQTTVKIGDIGKAKEMLKKLDSDKEFYDIVSSSVKANYNQLYNEDKFNTTFQEQFKVS
jgi:glutaredoxin-related protein